MDDAAPALSRRGSSRRQFHVIEGGGGRKACKAAPAHRDPQTTTLSDLQYARKRLDELGDALLTLADEGEAWLAWASIVDAVEDAIARLAEPAA
jgi:hypothetical protein